MNAIRMFAFVAAVLITAFVFRVIAYASTVQHPIHGAAASVVVSPQSTENWEFSDSVAMLSRDTQMDDISTVFDETGPESRWPAGLEQEPPRGALFHT
jgi:hypothetical protein